MTDERDPQQSAPEEQIDAAALEQQAYWTATRFAAPHEVPYFQLRGLPGLWGGSTRPLPLQDTTTGEFLGLVYLMQQFPAMTKVIVMEDLAGNRRIAHNFNPNQPFSEALNAHLNFQGDVKHQDPQFAKRTLNYIESFYQAARALNKKG